ncbi:MAG: thioesterase family protein, partial [Halobacteria archaeon]|nr:thioesterase family protein [Halobacteria archaeon]
MEDFNYTVGVDVRFRDLDYMEHVNNAVYATYLEHARANYFEDVIGLELGEFDFVVARLEIDYVSPIGYRDDVVVGARVPEMGEKSIPMEYVIETDGEVAAEGETVQVALDDEGEATTVP